MKWSGYNWITQERWGIMHTDKPYNWYDEKSVKVNKDGFLELSINFNPKKIIIDDKEYNPELGIGLVSSTYKDFTYGYYEIEAKLPNSPFSWPAFWMWSWESWPPEIDIFEGYTNYKGSYFKISNSWKIWKIWNIQTNIHYKINELKHKSIGSAKGFIDLFKKSPSKRFIKYGMLWKPDEITFYYDGRVVRKITDSKILDKIKGHKMNLILNNGVTKDDIRAIEGDPMIIKYFTYTDL